MTEPSRLVGEGTAFAQAIAGILGARADRDAIARAFASEILSLGETEVAVVVIWIEAELDQSLVQLQVSSSKDTPVPQFVSDYFPRRIQPVSDWAGAAIAAGSPVLRVLGPTETAPRLQAAFESGMGFACALPVNSSESCGFLLEILGAGDGARLLSPEFKLLVEAVSLKLESARLSEKVALQTLSFKEMSESVRELAQSLKESTRKERAMFESAMDVILIVDASLRISRANPAFRSVLGFDPESATGKSLFDYVQADREADITADSVELAARNFKMARENPAGASFENCMLRSDRSKASLSWSVHWSESEQSFFCVVHDVSQRKELEQLKQDFVAMISHDLRTPLTSVVLVLSLLQRGALSSMPEADVQKRLRQSLANLDFVVNLINSLLDMDKLSSGSLTLDFAPCLISTIVRKSVAAVEPVVEKSGINLSIDCEDIELECDEQRIRQVLINLLGNAVKFTPGGKTIEISARVVNGKVRLSVKDQGRGIPAEQIDAVFARGHQVRSSDRTELGGRGLGLSICRQLVELHGGTINVVSVEGEGSEFWFDLPFIPS